MIRKPFRSGIVTSRYWVNAAVIFVLLVIPVVGLIKLDFAHGEYTVLGERVSFVTGVSVFIGFWAGSYVLTLLADYIWGRLFCGWICTWGTLLRTLSYSEATLKRKKLARWWIDIVTIFFALLSTTGLMNWFVDLGVMFQPSSAGFVPVLSVYAGLAVTAFVMLKKVGLNFCQEYCPIGWYLTAVSQKHQMRIDFNVESCTQRGVCERECPMAMDPRLLIEDSERNSHSLCILCGDCLSACNACAAKVPGEKPLQLVTGIPKAADRPLAS